MAKPLISSLDSAKGPSMTLCWSPSKWMRAPCFVAVSDSLPRSTPASVISASRALIFATGDGLPTLASWLGDRHQDPASRALAAEALGACGRVQLGLVALREPLAEQNPDVPIVQMAAAGALIRLFGTEPQGAAGLDGRALQALGGAATVVEWLGDAPAGPAVNEGSAFKRLGSDARRLVAMELSRREVTQALRLLPLALQDANLDVRSAAAGSRPSEGGPALLLGCILLALSRRRQVRSVARARR